MDDTFKQALALTEQAVADQCDDKLKEVAGRETLNANYWKAKYEAEAAQSMLAGSQLSALRLQLKDAQSAVSATERSAIIEECAKALEPANHPILMAAVKVIRDLDRTSQDAATDSSSAPTSTRNETT